MENKAPFFEMPDEVKENHYAKPYYGDQRVPTPCNEAACKTSREDVLRAVMDAK
jgi:hypothetical protein